MRPDDDGLFLREDEERLGPYRWSAPTARVRLHVYGRFASLALSRPPQTPEARVVVTLPWSTFTIRVAGNGAWTSMRIFVPRRYRRSQLVATLATSSWFPVDDGLPDIRCLGVMVADGEVGRWGDRPLRRSGAEGSSPAFPPSSSRRAPSRFGGAGGAHQEAPVTRLTRRGRGGAADGCSNVGVATRWPRRPSRSEPDDTATGAHVNG